MNKTIMIIAAVLFLTGCGNNEKERANQLIEAARTHFEQGALDAARADIDSLRKQFPKEGRSPVASGNRTQGGTG